ncbi:hypothetical protein HYS94_04935 [Candidatus Daviesbacteria bacterium]|nr:hypothetical protein [Candidatus Daviesbacteria bacterium]
MLKDQRGIIHLLVILILLAGIVAGVYLVQQTQIFKPRAVSPPLSVPETSFSLEALPKVIQSGNPSKVSLTYGLGDLVQVNVMVRSDIDPANLFSAQIKYDPNYLEVDHIDFLGFIQNWVEQRWDEKGKISLVGGVPNPGYQTTTGGPAGLMASIYFKVINAPKGPGVATISFDDSSAIYRNSDNLNILVVKRDATISISSGSDVKITPQDTCVNEIDYQSPDWGSECIKCIAQNRPPLVDDIRKQNPDLFTGCSDRELINYWCNGGIKGGEAESQCKDDRLGVCASACGETGCIQVITPAENPQTGECKDFPSPCDVPIGWDKVDSCPKPVPLGDGNNDGKIDLADMSVLLSYLNTKESFPKSIDLNGDGVINSVDYSQMIKLLIDEGVIKG